MVFVNSMSDLFHESVPEDFIQRVFAVMNEVRIHTFQILTKRAERLAAIANKLLWPPNIWMGVSVETKHYNFRIDHLRNVPASTRFISFEPLLASVGAINLNGIHWAIVGGESGPKARPIQKEWVIEIKEQCNDAGIAFFFKQWGGINKKKTGRLLDGKIWNQVPTRTPAIP